jgi:phosphoglycolate phosphatase
MIDATAVADNEANARLGGTLYAGVEEGLRALAERYRLYIVSNCQSGYIENFLTLSGLGACFQDFECFGNTARSKGHNLRDLVERNKLRGPLMAGDAEGDEEAARENGIPFAFVTYGFGTAQSPDIRFDSFEELVRYLA